MENKKVQSNLTHWADITAAKIVREKGKKQTYVCASGITPSGTVHIGNFREIISVDLVVRALNKLGKKTRFIYSWDDYDVFRRVPDNLSRHENLSSYLRQPITLVPDPENKEASYARANEKVVEKLLPIVGIHPQFIYQSNAYRNSVYADGIKQALKEQKKIRQILNEHRNQPLSEDWLPISIFCGKCNKDTTKVLDWNKDWNLTYNCSSCDNQEEIDLRKTSLVKLLWRIDWPMRWQKEAVDFEPAGKDHHTEGGSFDTSQKIVKKVFSGSPPVTFQYDFIRIKGGGGKISSSSGEVVGLKEVLEVYQPEVLRYLFAGTRPNAEFAISFDLDVIKIYEDYDKCERSYYNKPDSPKALKKWLKQARIFELSQVNEIPDDISCQIPFRHLCNLLQIHQGDFEKVCASLLINEDQKPRFQNRAACAWKWLRLYAPDEFKFELRKPETPLPYLSLKQKQALIALRQAVYDFMADETEKRFSSRLFEIAQKHDLKDSDFFTGVYRVLINKDQGPRLVNFMYTITKERIMELLEPI